MVNCHWKVYILAKNYSNVSTISYFEIYLCEKPMSSLCQSLTILSWVLAKLCPKNRIFPSAPMLKYPKLRHQSLSLSPVSMLWKFVRSMLHIIKASQKNMDPLSWVFPIVSMIFNVMKKTCQDFYHIFWELWS